MPIDGLENTGMNDLGCIRLGDTVTENGRKRPIQLDHLGRLDPKTEDPERRKEIIGIYHELYGEKPKSIKVMIAAPTVDEAFDHWYMRYSQSGRQCRGDGIMAELREEKHAQGLTVIETGDVTKAKCEGKNCIYYRDNENGLEKKKRTCSMRGTLRVLLYEVPGLGLWKVGTGSIVSITNILGDLATLKGVKGRHHMIPIRLERYPHKMKNPKTGNSVTHHVITLSIEKTLEELLRSDNQLGVGQERLQIPAPELEIVEAAVEEPAGEAQPEPGVLPDEDNPAEDIPEDDQPEDPKRESGGPNMTAMHMISILAGTIGAEDVWVKRWVESSYICDVEETTGEKEQAIREWLNSRLQDHVLIEQAKKDVSKTETWYRSVGENPGEVDMMVYTLAKKTPAEAQVLLKGFEVDYLRDMDQEMFRKLSVALVGPGSRAPKPTDDRPERDMVNGKFVDVGSPTARKTEEGSVEPGTLESVMVQLAETLCVEPSDLEAYYEGQGWTQGKAMLSFSKALKDDAELGRLSKALDESEQAEGVLFPA